MPCLRDYSVEFSAALLPHALLKYEVSRFEMYPRRRRLPGPYSTSVFCKTLLTLSLVNTQLNGISLTMATLGYLPSKLDLLTAKYDSRRATMNKHIMNRRCWTLDQDDDVKILLM